MTLETKFEELERKMGIKVSQETINELFDIFKNEVKSDEKRYPPLPEVTDVVNEKGTYKCRVNISPVNNINASFNICYIHPYLELKFDGEDGFMEGREDLKEIIKVFNKKIEDYIVLKKEKSAEKA